MAKIGGRDAATTLAVAAVGLAVVAASAPAAASRSSVTILAVSDYHSHALPFFSEGRHGQAGVARAVAYLRDARAEGNAVVVSGGDTMNAGSPTWSDEHRCVEWPWWNGILDAMALGNHDLDYGWVEFERCRASARYPVLSANLVDARGAPLLAASGKPYLVKAVGGVRLGFFAAGGPDFPRLVRRESLPSGSAWADPIATARRIVETLRLEEKVQAVVFIGHQAHEDDEAMARSVPGIDLVLGSHSHRLGGLRTIPGTSTHTLSPYQYLTYVSRVRLEFEDGTLRAVTGGLVKMDASLPEDPEVAARVASLQAELMAKRPERFAVLGRAAVELSDAGISDGESVLGNWATEVLRREAHTHAFLATASGFRASIPAGDVTLEDLHAAIPYKNGIVTATMTGRQLHALLALSVSKAGSDGFSQQSGLRYTVQGGVPLEIAVLTDDADPAAGFAPLILDARYRVGTTDFQAFVAAGYQHLFAAAEEVKKTGLDAHQALVAALRARPASATLDGRSGARGVTPRRTP